MLGFGSSDVAGVKIFFMPAAFVMLSVKLAAAADIDWAGGA